jgi:hypothetical protein
MSKFTLIPSTPDIHFLSKNCPALPGPVSCCRVFYVGRMACSYTRDHEKPAGNPEGLQNFNRTSTSQLESFFSTCAKKCSATRRAVGPPNSSRRSLQNCARRVSRPKTLLRLIKRSRQLDCLFREASRDVAYLVTDVDDDYFPSGLNFTACFRLKFLGSELRSVGLKPE